jgi:hypothetical protein
MPEASAPNPQSDVEQLEAAADQAIAACGGDAREAVKALLIANEFLEAQISQGYVRGARHGRFNCYSGVAGGPCLSASDSNPKSSEALNRGKGVAALTWLFGQSNYDASEAHLVWHERPI